MAATDDNPFIDPEEIDDMLSNCDDPDVADISRYGEFKQISGRIFKTFSYSIHLIDPYKYFEDGEVPDEWLRVRGIDFHESVKWAIPFVALSNHNEMFVYAELNPDPEKNTTLSIAENIARVSKDYRFGMNLIDPLAAKIQNNTTRSVIDDLNRIFRDFQREGLCTGGVWEGWDTKSQIGRDRLRERIMNSVLCERPFNNEQMVRGVKTRLPTIWLFSSCKQTAHSLNKWRLDKNGKPEQAWSHFCTALEGILKDVRFRPRTYSPAKPQLKGRQYFHIR